MRSFILAALVAFGPVSVVLMAGCDGGDDVQVYNQRPPMSQADKDAMVTDE